MSNLERTRIRKRIETGLKRQEARERSEFATRAADARDRLTSAARAHPILLIAGGLAVGVALSTLIPRSPTRKLGRKSLSALAMIAELGIAYGRQAMEAAGETANEAGKSGKEKLGELSEAIADGAGKLRDKVAEKARK